MFSKKNNHIFFRPINSDRISIREINFNDEEDLFELLSNPRVVKYLSFDAYKSLDEVSLLITKIIDQYKNQNIFYLGIVNNENNKLIGYIGLSRYDLTIDTCQIVYALNEDYWGKGLMVDALKLFINYLFCEQKKILIIATHIDVNQNSGKVMIKAGMNRDCNYDQDMIIKGKTEKLIGYTIKKE